MFIVIYLYVIILINNMNKKESEPRGITEILFNGSPNFFGGLSNEEELAEECPAEFKEDNTWSEYAMKLFFGGGNISNWEWLSEDIEECKKQMACFHGLMGSFDLPHEDKEAVAGWMLSKMLKKVPEYLPQKKEN